MVPRTAIFTIEPQPWGIIRSCIAVFTVTCCTNSLRTSRDTLPDHMYSFQTHLAMGTSRAVLWGMSPSLYH